MYMQKHMCGADAGNDIQGLSVRCPSQVEEIVPTLDDDLLYGFALSRTAEECHPTVRDLRAGECVLGAEKIVAPGTGLARTGSEGC